MKHLGAAVLGTAVAVLGTAVAVLGTTVLGTAVLQPANRWIGKGTRPRLRLHGSLRCTQSSYVHTSHRRWEPVTA